MAKRRAAPKRRQSKVMKLNQAMPTKRSEKPSQPRKANRQEAPSESVTSVSETSSHQTARQDLWSLSTGMANEFAEKSLENFARTFGFLPPPSSRIVPAAQPPSRIQNGVIAVTRELINQFTQQADHNFQAMNALTRSRSSHELFKVQTEFAKGTFDSILQAAGRTSIIAIKMITEAGRIGQFNRGKF